MYKACHYQLGEFKPIVLYERKFEYICEKECEGPSNALNAQYDSVVKNKENTE
jgi:hypothetical protein